MKLTNSISLMLAAIVACSAAPATVANYYQLQPSERALIDARNSICGQYPDRDYWVLIGTFKVSCKTVQTRSEEAKAVTVDKNWYVEYRDVN